MPNKASFFKKFFNVLNYLNKIKHLKTIINDKEKIIKRKEREIEELREEINRLHCGELISIQSFVDAALKGMTGTIEKEKTPRDS
ncbi:MAG TPA: hypothetical protein PK921_02785 [Candidatus Portnoybacteria bacterium]|jgi:hypothetical protein|nr:hypothetical protein [Candidatus Portnoybacteria bacterium]